MQSNLKQKSQKQAVVDEVVAALGSSFTLGKDNALSMLTKLQLHTVKTNVAHAIINGEVAYSKSTSNAAEVIAYARSMVMNHLKKAKELNGGASSNTAPLIKLPGAVTLINTKVKLPKGVKAHLLDAEMLEAAKHLV